VILGHAVRGTESLGEAKKKNGVYSFKAKFFDFPTFWLNTPGTYYWQAYRIDCSGSDCKQEGPIVKFVNAMLTEAIRLRASDIHLEPYEKRFRVRFRVDGGLVEKTQPPAGAAAAIISRLKTKDLFWILNRRNSSTSATSIRRGENRMYRKIIR